MAKIADSDKISGLPSIAAADLETRFADIVTQIGGTYYGAGTVGMVDYDHGVVQAPVQGNLDGSNFRVGAGITNAQKAEPYSLFCLSFPFREANSYAVSAPVRQTIRAPQAMTFKEFSFGYSTPTAITSDITCTIYQNGSAVMGGALASGSVAGSIMTTSTTQAVIAKNDIITVQIEQTNNSVSNATKVYGIVVTIWATCLHLE